VTQSVVSLDCWYKWIHLLIFRIAILSCLFTNSTGCTQSNQKSSKSAHSYYITFLLLHDEWQYYFSVIFYHYYNQT